MVKKKQISIPKEERLKLYLPLLAQGMGARRIAAITHIPFGTVTTDLWKLRQESTLSPDDSEDGARRGPIQSIHDTAPLADWQLKADQIGGVMLRMIDQCIKEGESEQARRWTETFLKALQVKFGAVRIGTVNIDYKSLTFVDLPEAKRKEFVDHILNDLYEETIEANPDWQCPLCAFKKKAEKLKRAQEEGIILYPSIQQEPEPRQQVDPILTTSQEGEEEPDKEHQREGALNTFSEGQDSDIQQDEEEGDTNTRTAPRKADVDDEDE